MATVRFQDREYSCKPGETVLECLTGHGVRIPSSCRSGACQTCMMRSTDAGAIPAKAQDGLKPSLKAQGYFLSCVCHPTPGAEISVAMPGENAAPKTRAVLISRDSIGQDILRLVFEGDIPDDARPGQFFNLVRAADGLSRSYSAAATLMGTVELHVRLIQGGSMSEHIRNNLKTGDLVDLLGPYGACFYTPDNLDQPVILIGTGTGLAPLYGIATDALKRGHTGSVTLYHGSWNRAGLYYVNELHRLADEYPNFSYIPCVDEPAGGEPIRGERVARADVAAMSDHPDTTGYRAFVCGHPELVKSAKRKIYLAGASLTDIYSDAFVYSK